MTRRRLKWTLLLSVFGYARLVTYDENYELVPDILQKVEIIAGRVFTLYLRPGHKWSDGHPFTTEDFRYYWEDIIQNEELTPGGPPIATSRTASRACRSTGRSARIP